MHVEMGIRVLWLAIVVGTGLILAAVRFYLWRKNQSYFPLYVPE